MSILTRTTYKEELIGNVVLALHFSLDSTSSVYRGVPTYKRPWVIEQTGKRNRRFASRYAATETYKKIRSELT